jgi:hypothetical protein
MGVWPWLARGPKCFCVAESMGEVRCYFVRIREGQTEELADAAGRVPDFPTQPDKPPHNKHPL